LGIGGAAGTAGNLGLGKLAGRKRAYGWAKLPARSDGTCSGRGRRRWTSPTGRLGRGLARRCGGPGFRFGDACCRRIDAGDLAAGRAASVSRWSVHGLGRTFRRWGGAPSASQLTGWGCLGLAVSRFRPCDPPRLNRWLAAGPAGHIAGQGLGRRAG
jgi:hypothetical protein